MPRDLDLPGEYPRRTSALSVAVFCSSAPGTPSTVSLARDVGRLLGEGAHRLIYGGSDTGLMGEVVRAAHAHGSQIFGVILLPAYEQGCDITGPSMIVRFTKTICQRKDAIFAMADAFIALPGGLETFVEVLDLISLSHLGLNHKPIVLIQTCGEWQPMLDLLERIAQYALAGPRVATLLGLTSSAAEALEFVKRFPHQTIAGAASQTRMSYSE